MGDAEGDGSKALLTPGNYWYLVAKKNWVENAWFILMAHTEVEWGANWIYCDTDHPNAGEDGKYTFEGENAPTGTYKNWIINRFQIKNIIIKTFKNKKWFWNSNRLNYIYF